MSVLLGVNATLTSHLGDVSSIVVGYLVETEDELKTAVAKFPSVSLQWVVDAKNSGAALSFAGELGAVKAANWIIEKFTIDGTVRGAIAAFNKACSNGHLLLARNIAKLFVITNIEVRKNGSHLLRTICQRGFLETAKWFAKKYKYTAADIRAHNNLLLGDVCKKDRIDIANWLTTEYKLVAEDARDAKAFALACQCGALQMAKWLVDAFKLNTADVCENRDANLRCAWRNGHYNTAIWILRDFYIAPESRYRALNDLLVAAHHYIGAFTAIRKLVAAFGSRGISAKNKEDILLATCASGDQQFARWWIDECKLLTPPYSKMLLRAAKRSLPEQPLLAHWLLAEILAAGLEKVDQKETPQIYGHPEWRDFERDNAPPENSDDDEKEESKKVDPGVLADLSLRHHYNDNLAYLFVKHPAQSPDPTESELSDSEEEYDGGQDAEAASETEAAGKRVRSDSEPSMPNPKRHRGEF